MPHPVVIVDYDPRWPTMYQDEKARILQAIGHKVLAIEHIGSTAVPGLAAKPIIDMMAGVRGLADADECLPPLVEIGYVDVTPEPGNSEWYYCLGKGAHSSGYHLHLVRYVSDHWARHLAFRDCLRARPEVARQYYELKRRLAAEHGSDRVWYTNAKAAFIESVTAQARRS